MSQNVPSTRCDMPVVLAALHGLPASYRRALCDAMSWQALCYLLNGLSLDINKLVDLEAPATGSFG